MKTLTEQYRLIKNKKGNKGVFLKEAKRLYPDLITNSSTFKEASTILKQKNVISENFVGIEPINNPFGVKKKEPYEKAFENFLKEAEAKAEEKKVTKEVEEDQSHAYDTHDKNNPDNMIFGQIQMGYYYEMKLPENTDKTIDEIKDIVFKNLEKDPIYYTKKGQFGVDVGYTDDVPALGEPKEATGKYKSSGYGDVKGKSDFDYVIKESKKHKKKTLREGWQDELRNYIDRFFEDHKSRVPEGQKHLVVYFDEFMNWTRENEVPQNLVTTLLQRISNEESKGFLIDIDFGPLEERKNIKGGKSLKEHTISLAGGIVTGGAYKPISLEELLGEVSAEDIENQKEYNTELEKTAELSKEMDLEEDAQDAPWYVQELATAAESAYDEGMGIDEILSFIEQHLGGKYGDY